MPRPWHLPRRRCRSCRPGSSSTGCSFRSSPRARSSPHRGRPRPGPPSSAASPRRAAGASFAGRGRRVDEAIDLLAAALTDEFPDHDGPTWTVHDLGLRPRPVQRPRPPIWVGGSTRAALRRAAERGDGWLPQGTPRAELPAQIAYLRAHRARVRGDAPIEIGAISEVCYVGTPRFDGPPRTRTGRGEALAAGLRDVRAIRVSPAGDRLP